MISLVYFHVFQEAQTDQYFYSMPKKRRAEGEDGGAGGKRRPGWKLKKYDRSDNPSQDPGLAKGSTFLSIIL